MSEMIHTPEGDNGGLLNREDAAQFLDVKPLFALAMKSPDPAAALEKLVGLQERQQEKANAAIFWTAFDRAKAKLKAVSANKTVYTKSGDRMWDYADLNHLLEAVEPILLAEGIRVSMDSDRIGNNMSIVKGIVKLIDVHTGYVHQACAFFNAAGDPKGGDIGATTSAQRKALIGVLGLRTRKDDNARMLGELCTKDQIADLQERMRKVGMDERKFLDLMAAATWEECRQGKLSNAHKFLDDKESARYGKQTKAPSTTGSGAGVAGGAQQAAPPATPINIAEAFVSKMTEGACLTWILEQRQKHAGLVDEAMMDSNVTSLAGDVTPAQIRAIATRLKTLIG